MATFINQLNSQDLNLRKPKFTPNGRPLSNKKRSKIASMPARLDSSPVPMYMMQKPKSVTYMSLHDCIESRPPLRCDLVGPNPGSYSPKTMKSNASCVINPIPSNLKDERSRHSNDIWTYRVHPVDQGPNPSTYVMDNLLGMHQPIRPEAPSFTMGRKGDSSLATKKEALQKPGPNHYNLKESDELIYRKWPSFSIGYKRTPNKGISPGPAQYSPNYSYIQAQGPQYSMHRRSKHITGLKC